MGRIIEGYWDCNYCHTKGIRGSLTECPNCTKARDKSTKFYLNLDNITYVPEEEAKKINKNPDWICQYCNNLNSDDLEECKFCGAPRTKQNKTYHDFHSDEQSSEKVDSFKQKESYTDYSNFEYSNNTSPVTKAPSSKKLSKLNFSNVWVRTVIIALAAILLISGIVYLCIPKVQEILVQDISWEYSISIEKFKTVTENDIYLPTGARLLYMTDEIAYYEDVLDHYETRTREVAKQRISGYEEYVTGYRDLGNGYFEETTSTRPVYETYYETETYQEPIYRKEPVYRTRYFYEIDKWVYERSVNTSGNTKETYWGETNLKRNERVSSKSETYYISGINQKKDKKTKLQLSFEDWTDIQVDRTYKFKVSLGHGELVE